MRTTGTTFSAVGHLGLIGWLILGWGFDAEPLDFTTTTVSVVSGEEFEQMTAATTPVPGTADPTVPVPPEVDEAPPPPAEEEPTETAPPPDPVDPPNEEVPPPPPPPAPPEPRVPDVEPVEPVVPAPPPPTPDVEVTETPTPPQAERIATTPSAPTPPDTQIDEVVREEIVPDDTAPAEAVVEEEDATAPEDAATEIVIADLAPTTSVRPVARPSRPAPPVVTPEVDTPTAEVDTPTPAQPDPDTSEADVDAALAAALAPAAAPGPPMNESDRASFRVSVQNCWNVGGMSSAAQRVTITVAFSLTRDRKVVGNEVEMIGASGGDDAAVSVALRTARSAILRCQNQNGGFTLPADKYESWKDVELTFDPDEMRRR